MSQIQRYGEGLVVEGTTLRVDFTAFSGSVVPSTRAILTTSPGLTGGGDLSADRTISLAFSGTLPAALGTAATGSSGNPSRSDHVHPIPTSFTVLQIDKLGIAREASSLPVNGIGLANTAVIAYRNDTDSAWIGAIRSSLNTLVVGDSGNEGTDLNAGSSFSLSFKISGVERASLIASAFILNNDFPVQIKDSGATPQDILKLRTDDIFELGGTGSGIEGIRINADTTNGVAFRVSGSDWLLVNSAGTTTRNAIPFRGRNGSGTPLDLAVIDGGDVSVFGNTSLETKVQAATEVSLVGGGVAGLTVDSSGAWLFNSKSIRMVDTGSTKREVLKLDSSNVLQIGAEVERVQFSAGEKHDRTAVADADHTLLITQYSIAYTSLTAARTVTLPTAASSGAGAIFEVVDETGNASVYNITIDGNGSETINGSLTYVLNSAYGVVRLRCTGSAWIASAG